MRGNEFLDKMGLIDHGYVEAADKMPVKRKNTWVKWAAIAACLCLIIGGFIYLRTADTGADTDYTENPTVSDVDVNKPDNTANAETPEKPKDPITGDTETVGPEDQNNEDEEQIDEGLYIPQMELPDSVDTATMDMIGVVVYKGGIYTQSDSYIYDDAYKIEHLVGEYLGIATGTINEWSKQEDYAQEFASSVYGEVYTVNGYDPGFRICIRRKIMVQDGGESLSIMFLDRLNGITLANGEDLYEDRLRIRDRIESIQWQSDDAWNYGGDINDAAFDETAWDAFLDELYQGEFVNTYKWPEAFYEDKPYSSIVDNPNQVHLILNMEDGTTVRLRLIEDGYVGLEHTGWWYFEQIPGEAFDAIYNACEGTHIEDWIVAR